MTLLATVHARGTLAARPAAAAANEGYLYFATDGAGTLYRSNGASWDVNSPVGLADQGTATFLDWTTGAAPANPAAGKIRTYSKTGDTFAQRTSAGVETVFGAGGGGASAEFPTIYQYAKVAAASVQNPTVTIVGAASGRRLILGVGLLGRAVTSVTCTNVTWTFMKAKVDNTSNIELWVGVVSGGTSGTVITINTASAGWINAQVVEVAEALTPTLASSADAGGATTLGLARSCGPITPTAGRIVVGMQGLGGNGGAFPMFSGAIRSFTPEFAGWPGSMDVTFAPGSEPMWYGSANGGGAAGQYSTLLIAELS